MVLALAITSTAFLLPGRKPTNVPVKVSDSSDVMYTRIRCPIYCMSAYFHLEGPQCCH